MPALMFGFITFMNFAEKQVDTTDRSLAVIDHTGVLYEALAKAADAQAEEFKHFGMDLEFLLRRTPKWRAALEAILFREGDIVEHGEQGEKAEEHA